MREIKFRAWGHHTWGSAPDDNDMEMPMIPLDEKSMIYDIGIINALDEQHSNPDELVFMQYTRLKDNNGKEIYEGDIIENSLGIAQLIGWVDRIIGEDDGLCCGFPIGAPLDSVKVIGNKFQNPELLETIDE